MAFKEELCAVKDAKGINSTHDYEQFRTKRANEDA